MKTRPTPLIHDRREGPPDKRAASMYRKQLKQLVGLEEELERAVLGGQYSWECVRWLMKRQAEVIWKIVDDG